MSTNEHSKGVALPTQGGNNDYWESSFYHQPRYSVGFIGEGLTAIWVAGYDLLTILLGCDVRIWIYIYASYRDLTPIYEVI